MCTLRRLGIRETMRRFVSVAFKSKLCDVNTATTVEFERLWMRLSYSLAICSIIQNKRNVCRDALSLLFLTPDTSQNSINLYLRGTWNHPFDPCSFQARALGFTLRGSIVEFYWRSWSNWIQGWGWLTKCRFLTYSPGRFQSTATLPINSCVPRCAALVLAVESKKNESTANPLEYCNGMVRDRHPDSRGVRVT